MAEINGYIKGIQVYFVGNEYERDKAAAGFAEKYGDSAAHWADAIGIGCALVECNLVQDRNEGCWDGVKYIPSRGDGAFVLNTQKEDGTLTTYNPSRATDWARGVSVKDQVPVYYYSFVGQKSDVQNVMVRLYGTGEVIAEYPGWMHYNSGGDDKTDALIDTAFAQQGKGLLASFMRYVKKQMRIITRQLATAGEEIKELTTNAFLKISNNNQTLGTEKAVSGDNEGGPFIALAANKTEKGLNTIICPQGVVLSWGDGQYALQGNVEGFYAGILADDNANGIAGGLFLFPEAFVSGGVVDSTDKVKLGVYIEGKTAEDLLTAYGETIPTSTFAKQADFTAFQSHVSEALDFEGENVTVMPAALPLASTTERGGVKMAGKVDALADDATLAQTVDRLNTLVAYLKSAGLMSEN